MMQSDAQGVFNRLISGVNVAEITVSATLMLLVFVNASYQFNVVSPVFYNVVHMVSLACLGLLIAWFCISQIDKITLFGFLLVCGTGALFLLNEILFPETADEAERVFVRFALYCLPLIVIASQIESPEVLYRMLRKCTVATVLVVVFLLVFRFSVAARSQQETYSMGLGYALLPFALLAFNEFMREGLPLRVRIVFCLYGLIISSGVVILGSRGPLVCIGCFFVLTILRWIVHGRRPLSTVIILLLLATMLLSYRVILGFAAQVLSMGGFSRTGYLLEQFLQTGEIHLSGRDELQAPLFDEVLDDPFAIRGIAADRVFAGMNAHNLLLEVAFCFGILALAILTMFLLAYFVKCLKAPIGRYGDLVAVFFSASVPSLMYSGSLWDNMLFWIGTAITFFALCSGREFGRRADACLALAHGVHPPEGVRVEKDLK